MRNLLANRGTRLAAVISLVAISVFGFNVAPASAELINVGFVDVVTPEQCPESAAPYNVCARLTGTINTNPSGFLGTPVVDSNGKAFRVCAIDWATQSKPDCWYPAISASFWNTTQSAANLGQFTFPVSSGPCNVVPVPSADCTYFVQFHKAYPAANGTAAYTAWDPRVNDSRILRYGADTRSSAASQEEWLCPASGGSCVLPTENLPDEETPQEECGTLDVRCAIGNLITTIQDTLNNIFIPDTEALETATDGLVDDFVSSPLGAGVTMFRTWLTMCIPQEGATAPQCWASARPDKILSIAQIDEQELAASGLQQFGVISYNYPNNATQPACLGPIIKMPIASVFDDLGENADAVRAAYLADDNVFAENKLLAPFRACDGHARTVADLVRNLLTGVLYVGFAWFLANQIMAMVGIIGGMGVGAINSNASARARGDAQTARESAQVGKQNKRADSKRAAKAASDNKKLGW